MAQWSQHVRCRGDIVAKVFLGWRTKIFRAADAFSARRREGPYRFSEKRPPSFVGAPRVLQGRSWLKIKVSGIFDVVRFSTFATKSPPPESGHRMSVYEYTPWPDKQTFSESVGMSQKMPLPDSCAATSSISLRLLVKPPTFDVRSSSTADIHPGGGSVHKRTFSHLNNVCCGHVG
jgi:hypothetical protein